jgi:hypothetical protein
LFRRGQQVPTADEAPEQAAAEAPARAEPKGRPTPSRKEAEAARKARVKPPLEKRARGRAGRDQVRADRTKARQALATGDERYLPARDKGPIRGFARDYVDSRRTVGEYMLPALLLIVPLTLALNSIGNKAVQETIILGTYAYMLLIVSGTALLAYRTKRAAVSKFPDADMRGIGLYAAMRSLQVRRWRLPKSRVKPGDSI